MSIRILSIKDPVSSFDIHNPGTYCLGGGITFDSILFEDGIRVKDIQHIEISTKVNPPEDNMPPWENPKPNIFKGTYKNLIKTWSMFGDQDRAQQKFNTINKPQWAYIQTDYTPETGFHSMCIPIPTLSDHDLEELANRYGIEYRGKDKNEVKDEIEQAIHGKRRGI